MTKVLANSGGSVLPSINDKNSIKSSSLNSYNALKKKTIITTFNLSNAAKQKSPSNSPLQPLVEKNINFFDKERKSISSKQSDSSRTSNNDSDVERLREKENSPAIKFESTNQPILKSSNKETKETDPSINQKPIVKFELKKIKRSSSESNIHINNNIIIEDPDVIGINGKLFKSKSTRNLKSGRILQEIVKNRNTIRLYNSVPSHSMPPLHITNQAEVKKNFLESKIPPVLKFKADQRTVQNLIIKHSKTNYDHFFKAKNILDLVKAKYSGGVVSYYEANFGKKIKSQECIELIGKYLEENKITGEMTINFAPGLTCSGRIVSYNIIKNKPEARKFGMNTERDFIEIII